MKKWLTRWLSLALCCILVLGQANVVGATGVTEENSEVASEIVEEATEDVIDEEASDEENEDATEGISEELSEEVSEDISEEMNEEVGENTSEEVSEEATEEISEEVSEEASEEISEEVSEEATEEISEEVSEEISEEETEEADDGKIFTGLTAAFSFSNDMLAQKNDLSTNLNSTVGGKEGVDYATNQILVKAENEAQAEMFAEAFDGVLLQYTVGIAVIELNQEGDDTIVTVAQAVTASADPANYLPAAWPNTIYHTCDVKGEMDPGMEPGNVEYQWQHEVVDTTHAWNNGYTGEGVTVAVLDTGIRIGHEDLNPAKVNCTSADKQAEVDKWELGIELGPDDNYDGHGTHVNGIIAAQEHNGLGGAGIAPDVELISCNVFSVFGAYTDDIIEGINWAVENDADIINMSLGSIVYNGLFAEAVANAYEDGVAVFCAAGNDNTSSYQYPANYPGAISIAALDYNMQKASFSCYGPNVRYAFPGVNIYSTYNGEYFYVDPDGDESTDDGYYEFELGTDGYTSLSGTSMATPAAAGTAAVLLQYATTEGMMEGLEGSARVDNLLKVMDTALISVNSKNIGKGCVSFAQLFDTATFEGKPDMPVIISSKIPQNKVIGEMTEIKFAEVPEYITLCYTTDGKTPSVKNGVPQGSTKETGTTLNIGGKKTVTLKVMACNYYTGECSKVLTAKYTFAPLPTMIGFTNKSGKNILNPGDKVTLKAEVLPDYTPNKKVFWSVKGNPEGVTVKNGVVSVSKKALPGTYDIYATSQANESLSVFYRIKVAAADKKITAIISTNINTEYVVGKGETFEINSIRVQTNDGSSVNVEDLHWTSSKSKVALVYAVGNSVIVYGLSEGETRITGTATDGSKQKIVLTVQVQVEPENCEITGDDKIIIGKTKTYKITASNKKLSAKDVTWRIHPEDKGVTVKDGKVSVSKEADITISYNLLADSKVTGTTIASKRIYLTNNPVKSLKIDSKYKNVSLARSLENMDSYAIIPLNVVGGDIETLSLKCEYTGAIEFVGYYAYEEGDIRIIIYAKDCAGTGTVKVSTTDGTKKSVTIKVNVVNPASRMEITYPDGRCTSLAYGKTMQLIPVFGTAYGKLKNPEKTITWTSYNPDIIAVDKNGKIKAKSYEGGAYIEAYSELYGVCGGIYITATDLITKMEIEEKDPTLYAREDGGVYWGADIYLKITTKHGGTTLMPYDGYCEAIETMVDKEGMTFTHSYEHIEDEEGDSGFFVVDLAYAANKAGTYKVTIKLRDGNTKTVKRTYKFH